MFSSFPFANGEIARVEQCARSIRLWGYLVHNFWVLAADYLLQLCLPTWGETKVPMDWNRCVLMSWLFHYILAQKIRLTEISTCSRWYVYASWTVSYRNIPCNLTKSQSVQNVLERCMVRSRRLHFHSRRAFICVQNPRKVQAWSIWSLWCKSPTVPLRSSDWSADVLLIEL